MFQTLIQSLLGIFKHNRSSTVRTAFPVIVAALVIAGAAVITADDDVSQIILETKPNIVHSDEEFTINVKAIAHTPANTVDVEITYPENQIEILGVDTGESVITLWTEKPTWEDGVITMNGGAFRKGFLGEHLIARIQARAKGTGKALITATDARLLAGDGKGTELRVGNRGRDSEVYVAKTGETTGNSSPDIAGELSLGVVTDLDGDGEVGFSDVSAFMNAWRTRSKTLDFNGDGHMTFKDFAIILSDSFFK